MGVHVTIPKIFEIQMLVYRIARLITPFYNVKFNDDLMAQHMTIHDLKKQIKIISNNPIKMQELSY